jgi:VIT1/CCC1 family predicted Fe2+/Mn2+ transporter
MKKSFFTTEYIRSFTFGTADSLVSTVGFVSGVAAVDTPRSLILLTGMVLIFVEAFSMGVGSLLSDNTAKEFEGKKTVPMSMSVATSLVMFVSYFFSGFIVLAPYIFFSRAYALPISVCLSLVALFTLGAFNGRMTHTSQIKKGSIMAIVGGIAVFVGVAVGLFLVQI